MSDQMQTYTHSYDFAYGEAICTLLSPFVKTSLLHPESLCIFDIETTGLSPEISSVYLIGCTYFDNGKLCTIQWFANDYISEQALIEAFFSFIKNYQVLIHYNGSTFDLPYIQKKCDFYHIPNESRLLESFDLYRLLRKARFMLCLNNLKQKTVEQYMRINRDDQYDGGELILTYTDYMKEKYAKHVERQEELLQLLLLHNHDDIVGLTKCLLILEIFHPIQDNTLPSSIALFDDHIQINYTTRLRLNLTADFSCYRFKLSAGELSIEVPLIEQTYKRFFSDYKHYFYLPVEDTAIHESVATFVDKDFRKKATRQTAYIKTTGTFLPLSEKKGKKDYPDFLYYESYHTEPAYMLLPQSHDEQMTQCHLFCQMLIKRLLALD